MRLTSTFPHLVAGLLLLSAFCAHAAQTAAVAVPELDLNAPLPGVAATYVTTRSEADHAHAGKNKQHAHADHAAQPMEWRFFREANRIEIEDMATQTGELWQRDGKVQFFFKIFHADQRSIEYRMDDMQMLGISSSWQQHALLVEPDVLQKLSLVEAGWRDGYPFRRLRGNVNGDAWEITWRVDMNLPVRIKREHDGHVEVTELKAVHALERSPWQRRNSRVYDVIDYADLGDRESDPFVMRVQGQLPGGDVHRH